MVTPKTMRFILLMMFALLLSLSATAQDRTVGVLTYEEGTLDGYTLLVPQFNAFVYLIDNDGRIVHTWELEETIATREAHLLDNGNVVVVATPRDKIDISLIPSAYLPDGSIREYTWDGELVWEYQFISAEDHQHHGIEIMPNGNILAVVWEYHTLDEAVAMGLDPQYLDNFEEHPYFLPDKISEISRETGEIIWEWNPWNHLVQDFDESLPNYGDIAENPGRVDINYQSYVIKDVVPTSNAGHGDWMHANGVNYNPNLDQIAFSVRSYDELWIIDHTDPGEETSDILYRWGNPFAYGQGDFVEDRILYGQHDLQWIDDGLPGAGNMLVFNNNTPGEDGPHSTIIEFAPPLQEDGTYDWSQEAEIVWTFETEGFHSHIVSGMQRLPNGNTFITEGYHGRLLEVNPDGEIVWEFVNPETQDGRIAQGEEPNAGDIPIVKRNFLFRIRKYAADHPALVDKDLTPGEYMAE